MEGVTGSSPVRPTIRLFSKSWQLSMRSAGALITSHRHWVRTQIGSLVSSTNECRLISGRCLSSVLISVSTLANLLGWRPGHFLERPLPIRLPGIEHGLNQGKRVPRTTPAMDVLATLVHAALLPSP